MRQNAAEYDAANEIDEPHDGLSFSEFCQLVREREIGDHTPQELRKRFRALDLTGSGFVSKDEYLRFSLRDALGRSCARITQIMETWDTDGNGQIDLKEFTRAVRSLGYADIKERHIAAIFREFDVNESGEVSRSEMSTKLQKYAGVAVEQRYELRRSAGGRKGAALATTVQLDTSTGRTVPELIREALSNANISADAVSFTEMVANGTDMGDYTEVQAVANNLLADDRTSPLVLGGFNANLGHPTHACGLVGLIKCILNLKHRAISPQINIDEPIELVSTSPGDPECLVAPSSLYQWGPYAGALVGSIHGHGFSGVNVQLTTPS